MFFLVTKLQIEFRNSVNLIYLITSPIIVLLEAEEVSELRFRIGWYVCFYHEMCSGLEPDWDFIAFKSRSHYSLLGDK